MTYFHDLNTYLHQSSLLVQTYPTARVSSKYSLPRKPTNTKAPKIPAPETQTAQTTNPSAPAPTPPGGKEKREPSATLTLKTFHPESGICLKYRTDKAQEVGRLIGGLGRLAKGEVIEMPTTSITSTAPVDKMDVDDQILASEPATAQHSKTESTQTQTQTQTQSAGGKKKKKGKK